jgi:bacillithiol system protein YtxJ
LEDESQFSDLLKSSFTRPIILFKHSTRCSISSMVFHRIGSIKQDCDRVPETYFLDLLRHRHISNMVADNLGVYHESPQVLLLSNGECVYEASHNEIRVSELQSQISLLR